MSARLLDGHAVAAAIREAVLPDARAFAADAGRPPGLGIVLVGDDAGSEIYVRNKAKAGGESGLRVDLERLPATASIDAVLEVVDRLNRSPVHDGILVQAPLPAGLGKGASQRVFDAIDPSKDVDGFHPINVGRLVQGRALLAPCTPSGIIEMLERSGVRIGGATAVVIGRSEIVGKPMSLLLLQRDATVTICHSKTPDLPVVAARADILVAAIGRPGFVTPAFVKPGATVDRRRHQSRQRPIRRAGAVGTGVAEARGLRAPRFDCRRRRPPGCGRGCRRAHAGSRRGWSADDCHAVEEHRHGGPVAARHRLKRHDPRGAHRWNRDREVVTVSVVSQPSARR